uniref:SKI-interacting protein SKIP SNW domain-containing protein n=1 Tax=Chromera velia CCMP2878 TaxID=1169474 RepID=A0A0G4GQ91_9ALVE|mmetsp:Transcript_54087/g.105843  ORF Transcript_54087/g.105843 Transcript_54087/m.105843 type:complete len:503 (+) Transcript_54087:252-1760(+)|eukprot:Cvel_729.t1-p1 / transcript=Cvel_729.t1 / gene=Cvel_729 / organism=Chromera_velia_CCMP2878 / gene_product=SNW domain-containing protein 1, putative / transcript_product=SNW domain-containing protein 1, putative / location=Cvel_scaffold22:160847-165871(+) / protein_length=502 / sequence_SO=supercontig / SO=protein_coding / is_pseudo=false
MTDFLRKLPAPKQGGLPGFKPVQGSFAVGQASSSTAIVGTRAGPPPYGSRKGWIPRNPADFGDGGAFPEIPMAQFPLDMGKKTSAGASRTVALQMGADGKVEYDAVLKQGSTQIMYSKPGDQIAAHSSESKLTRPGEEQERATVEKTRAAMEAVLAKKTQGKESKPATAQDAQFYKYTPNDDAPGKNPSISQRVIRMVEKQVDPMEPPKFKHKKQPKAPGSPPPPVQHSPPRKLTQKDQQDWKIPPCVSNWKNQKGYTIPLDKRIQADGRQLQEHSVNDKFAAFTEDLMIAERKAREEIRLRTEMMKNQKQLMEKQREEQLRQIAMKAREEREAMKRRAAEDDEEDEQRQRRAEIEKGRKREIERDFRLEQAGKKSKRGRDEDRDVSEVIALGGAAATSQESMFDARLFNQSSGLDTGYNAGGDEGNPVYDKPMWADRSRAGGYTHDRERFQQNVGDMGAVPGSRGFEGGAAAGGRDTGRTAPIEFEKDVDPFGLDSLYKKK